MLCWVYCGQWSALVSCWQAFGRSLWACCPSTPYHRSIDLLLQVPASVSVSAFFMSLPVSLPPSAPLSDYPSSSFASPFVFFLLSSAVLTRLLVLICLLDSHATLSPPSLSEFFFLSFPTITITHVSKIRINWIYLFPHSQSKCSTLNHICVKQLSLCYPVLSRWWHWARLLW